MINLKYHSKKYLFALFLLLVLGAVTCGLFSAAIQTMVALPESEPLIEAKLPKPVARFEPVMKAPIQREVALITPSATPLPLPVPVMQTQPIAENQPVQEVYQGIGASPLATPTNLPPTVVPTDTHTTIVVVTATTPPAKANTPVVSTLPETQLVNTPIAIATTTPNRTATALFFSQLAPTTTPTALSNIAQAPTVGPTSTVTATPLPTLTNSPTSSATATAAANSPVVDTATTEPTLTATPLSTATSEPTQAPTLIPTATHTLTPVPTATNTTMPQPTATNTATLVPATTPLVKPSATNTPTSLPTATHTPPPTATATHTATLLPTLTHTSTSLPTATHTATPLPTATPYPTSTSTKTATPLPTPTNTPNHSVVHRCGQVIEAETAILSGLMQVGEDQNASGGRYVHVPNRAGGRSTINDDKMTFNLNLGQTGNYQFMGHVYGNNNGADSFFVQVNKYPGDGFIWGFQSNTSYQGAVIIPRGSKHPFEIKLEAGSHQLEIMLREDGARLDKIQLICVN